MWMGNNCLGCRTAGGVRTGKLLVTRAGRALPMAPLHAYTRWHVDGPWRIGAWVWQHLIPASPGPLRKLAADSYCIEGIPQESKS